MIETPMTMPTRSAMKNVNDAIIPAVRILSVSVDTTFIMNTVTTLYSSWSPQVRTPGNVLEGAAHFNEHDSYNTFPITACIYLISGTYELPKGQKEHPTAHYSVFDDSLI